MLFKINAKIISAILIVCVIMSACSAQYTSKGEDANSTAKENAIVNVNYKPTSKPTKTGDTGDGKFTYYAEEGCLIIDGYNKFLPCFAYGKAYGYDCGYISDDGGKTLTAEEIDSIKSVIINDGVTMIYNDPFNYFESLEVVTLPKSLKRILSSTFESTKNLKTINYGGSEEEWENIKIDRCNDYIKNAVINYNIEIDESNAVKYDDIEEEAKTIGDNINVTLNYFTGVVNIDGEGALIISQDECDTVATDIDSLFMISPVGSDGCVAPFVDEIIIGEGITSIGSGVFKATSASAITLPKSLTSISKGAFAPHWDAENNAFKLKTVKYCGTKSGWKKINISNDGNENLLNAEIIY